MTVSTHGSNTSITEDQWVPCCDCLVLSSYFITNFLTAHTSGRISGALVASFPGSLQCESNHERSRNDSVGYIGNVTGGENGDGEQHKDSRFSSYEYFLIFFPTINAPLYKNSLNVTALCKNCSRVESQCVTLPLQRYICSIVISENFSSHSFFYCPQIPKV